ncbi:TetR/AcrR family transcriptional regulator [Microbacteriaceae bacterium K1510]|nr:TetR/AcrR family transcriptional regulator [Microbacteriaceae bacterium K1510]
MKVSKEQVAKHREAILDAAGRLFRQRGFDSVTVAEIMKEAGLTHGAFYGYFPSKEALIAEAAEHALIPPPTRAPAATYADNYLSVQHRDNHATGCVFAALGTEAARGSDDLRHRMTDSVRRQIERFSAEAKGRTARDRRQAAIAAWSSMIGAVMLARLVDDEALSEEILSATRASLPLA